MIFLDKNIDSLNKGINNFIWSSGIIPAEFNNFIVLT